MRKAVEQQLDWSCPSRVPESTGRDSHKRRSRIEGKSWQQGLYQCWQCCCRRLGYQGTSSKPDKQEVDSSAVHRSRRYQEHNSKGCHKDNRRESHRLVGSSATWGRLVAGLVHEQVIRASKIRQLLLKRRHE